MSHLVLWSLVFHGVAFFLLFLGEDVPYRFPQFKALDSCGAFLFEDLFGYLFCLRKIIVP